MTAAFKKAAVKPPLSFLARMVPAKVGAKATPVKKAAPKKAVVAEAKPTLKKAAPKKVALKNPTAKLSGKKAARQPVGLTKPVAKKVALKKVAAKAKTAAPKKAAVRSPFLFWPWS